MKIPTTQLKNISMKFPVQYRQDLVQDMSLLFLESPEEKQTPQYVYTTYPLRCKDFIKKYRHDPSKVILLDDTLTDEDGDGITHADLLVGDDELEERIIHDDMINNLQLTEEERLIQRLYYFEGYSAEEIAKNFSQKTFITSVSQVYNILKKGQ